MFIPEPSIPEPGSASNNLSILTQNIGCKALGNMIRVVHTGFGSCFFPIPDPGSRGQKVPDHGSGSATLKKYALKNYKYKSNEVFFQGFFLARRLTIDI